MRAAAITGTGLCVPSERVTNEELDRRLGEPVGQWLVEKVGIHERRFMRADQTTSDLCVIAGRQALERAGVKPGDVDLVIIATDTPDHPSPATAAVVQHKLGLTKAGGFDLNCACAGFVTALDVGSKLLLADQSVRHVLVIGAYGMSRFLDWTDKTTCTLFADGAGAVVLSASDKPGYLGGVLGMDGSFHDALGIYAGGASQPAGGDVRQYVKFVKKFPKTFNVERWPQLLQGAAAKANVSLHDVKLFIFTQLNRRTIEGVMEAMGYPTARAHFTMTNWGYTGSACLPMTLHDAVEAGRLKSGDLVAFCASGGGISMGAAIVRWS